MSENEIATLTLDICFKIHRQYGPGLLESVYEQILCYELGKAAIPFTCHSRCRLFMMALKWRQASVLM
jgi:GxxExxY protein